MHVLLAGVLAVVIALQPYYDNCSFYWRSNMLDFGIRIPITGIVISAVTETSKHVGSLSRVCAGHKISPSMKVERIRNICLRNTPQFSLGGEVAKKLSPSSLFA